MMLFRTLLTIDAAAAAGVVFFFVWGLSDGSVSSFNIVLWLMMLGGVGAVIGGGLWLRSQGQLRISNGVLLILAIPTLLFAVFALSLIILQPRWN